MNYFWTVCPKCAGELTIQFVSTGGGVSGSVRRWSSDRSINDGRMIDTLASALAADGAFRTACVCGEPIPVDPSRVTRATTERPAL